MDSTVSISSLFSVPTMHSYTLFNALKRFATDTSRESQTATFSHSQSKFVERMSRWYIAIIYYRLWCIHVDCVVFMHSKCNNAALIGLNVCNFVSNRQPLYSYSHILFRLTIRTKYKLAGL